jgi:CDP-glycerol glycerophosphotransferase (TagB/SpsB family)
MYPIIRGIAEQNPGFEVVIKPHPKEDMKSLLSFFGKDKPGNITIVGAYSPLYELISVSDIVTTKDSTAGFEATLMGKRTIYLNFNREKRNCIPFAKYGAGAEAKSFEDFNELARKGMAGKNQGALSFIYAKNDGNATKRVLEEIYALLRG